MDATLRKKEKYNGAERSLQCFSRFFGIVSSIACILPSRFTSKVESFRLEVKKGDFVVFRFERERRVSTVKSSFLLITLSRKSDVKYEERYSPSLVAVLDRTYWKFLIRERKYLETGFPRNFLRCHEEGRGY